MDRTYGRTNMGGNSFNGGNSQYDQGSILARAGAENMFS